MSGRWAENEIEILKEKYPEYPNKVLSKEHLESRTKQAISRKARRLGLEKEDRGVNFRWNKKCY